MEGQARPGGAADVPEVVYVVDETGEAAAAPTCPPFYSDATLQSALHLLGLKPRHARRCASRAMQACGGVGASERRALPAMAFASAAAISRRAFEQCVAAEVVRAGKAADVDGAINDLRVAFAIAERRRSVAVLLAGTSGCGKSTLASLLAAHLGITTVVSTDSLRHVMRSVVSTEEDPVLHASSYEAGGQLPPEGGAGAGAGSSGASAMPADRRRVVRGYKAQAAKVIEHVDALLTRCAAEHESIVVEGVHLSLNLVVELMRRHKTVVPFLIYIRDEGKHRERFAVRAKYMALDPEKNKYVRYLRNIRTIQEWLIAKADKVGVPRLSNSNVDRSVAILSSTIFACAKHMAAGRPLLVERAPKVVGAAEGGARDAGSAGSDGGDGGGGGDAVQLPRKRSARPVRDLFSQQVSGLTWSSKATLAAIRRKKSEQQLAAAAPDDSGAAMQGESSERDAHDALHDGDADHEDEHEDGNDAASGAEHLDDDELSDGGVRVLIAEGSPADSCTLELPRGSPGALAALPEAEAARLRELLTLHDADLSEVGSVVDIDSTDFDTTEDEACGVRQQHSRSLTFAIAVPDRVPEE